MKEKTFKITWATTQILLFILPILLGVIMTPYDIGWDQHYVDNVNERAFQDIADGKVTDFNEAVVSYQDSKGVYEKKVWHLQNQGYYYWFANIFWGVFIGFVLQLFNLGWGMIWSDHY